MEIFLKFRCGAIKFSLNKPEMNLVNLKVHSWNKVQLILEHSIYTYICDIMMSLYDADVC